mmetsp:Transcript_25543/g.61530  ORF Transcript_25543/g.61530 Transcript_25543/m.61530 type:complete len:114 (+) Transcript_25543:1431-1772(+)
MSCSFWALETIFAGESVAALGENRDDEVCEKRFRGDELDGMRAGEHAEWLEASDSLLPICFEDGSTVTFRRRRTKPTETNRTSGKKLRWRIVRPSRRNIWDDETGCPEPFPNA